MSTETVDAAAPPPLEVIEELERIELARGGAISVTVVRSRPGGPPFARIMFEPGEARRPHSVWVSKFAARAVADALAEFAARSW